MYYSKNKLKSFCVFLIPVMLCLIYLIFNNALDEFFNYCVFGLFDFGTKNSVFSVYTYCEVVILIYLFYQLYRTKFKDKEVVYILMFQIMSYPIFDIYHFLVSFIPVFYYFIKKIKSFHLNFLLFFIVYALFFVYLSTCSININKEDNFLYLLNDSNNMIEFIDRETKIIFSYNDKYDYSFYIMTNAYLRKLYGNIPINKYDFMLNGNMGYDGGNRLVSEIEDICTNNTCVFYVNNNMYDSGYNQFSKEIYDYVINNYKQIDEYDTFCIYSN